MKSLKMLAVILLAGTVVASALMSTAEADPGKVKLTVACTGAGGTVTVTNGGNAVVVGSCTINGGPGPVPIPLSSDVDVKIAAAAGVGVTVIINDAAGDHHYNVKGDVSDDLVTYTDDIGDDELYFKGNGGSNSFTVNDAAGNDKYNATDALMDMTDGAGNDKYEGKDISAFLFADNVAGDKDEIGVKTG